MAKKTLVIMESPHKAQVVSKILGSDYIVKASVGHVRDLAMPKQMTADQRKKYGDFGIDVTDPNFEPLYKVDPGKTKIVSDLKAQLARCDELILLTDSDSEGHAIALHLLDILKPKVPTYRATSNEITPAGISEALRTKQLVNEAKREPREFFQQGESAMARSSWDRMYGFSTSPYLWKVLKPGTSSGRVQIPAASLVVDRELRRLKFTSVPYYSIIGRFGATVASLAEYKGQKVANGSHIDEQGKVADGYLLITDSNLGEILRALKVKTYEVGAVNSKPYRRSAPPPFNTSTALQSIGGKTRMGSKQITAFFQQLYAQDSAVTYIRTVSVVAAPEAIAAARKSLARDYGQHFVHATPKVFKDKKQGNSGHECLRPVLQGAYLLKKSFSDPKKQAVFDSIYKRMLASQAIDCTGTTWSASFVSADQEARFTSSATEIHEAGWTKVYGADDSEEGDTAAAANKLKKLSAGDPVELTGLKREEHKTTPPARFTEVQLIAKLEEEGIGRPATFASMVSVIQERGYVVKLKNQLVPTFMGFAAVNLLRDAFPRFTDYGYTAELEGELDEIIEGKTSRAKFLDGFWNGKQGFAATVEGLKSNIDWTKVRELSTLDMGNGYGVVFNKFGAWLEHLEAPADESGRHPSVKLMDDETVEELDLRDVEVCKQLFERQSNQKEAKELGTLAGGAYDGYTVTLRDGKFGIFLQAKGPKATDKPVNMKLPEGMGWDDVTFENIKGLFDEVKLPRTLSDQFFVGIGARGPWAGRKASPKARRAVFISLEEGMDPRTVTLAEVEDLWKRKQEVKQEKEAKTAAKKTAAKKAAAPATRKTAAKRTAPRDSSKE